MREQGKLVTKERFLEEVWRGVPVTDEALTQCIKTLRRQLGDDASNPRFIETAPKHGYRFIAPVEWVEGTRGSAMSAPSAAVGEFLTLGLAGTIGGGAAGMLGGFLYSFVATGPGMGAVSTVLVLVAITALVGVLGGAGVGFGIAVGALAPLRMGQWSILGGALGGLLVGSLVKLMGVDAFNLLFGQGPGEITGGPEGALLGGAVGLGVWLANKSSERPRLRLNVAVAAATGGAAGATIELLGGRLMAGSLHLLAQHFPTSRLHFDRIGVLFGEYGFGQVSQTVTSALEGALFGACVVGAMIYARRRRGDREKSATLTN